MTIASQMANAGQTYTLTDVKARFSELVKRVMRGEEIIVTRMGEPAVKIVPCHAEDRPPLLGLLAGQGEVHGEFNEWPEDIAKSLGITD